MTAKAQRVAAALGLKDNQIADEKMPPEAPTDQLEGKGAGGLTLAFNGMTIVVPSSRRVALPGGFICMPEDNQQ